MLNLTMTLPMLISGFSELSNRFKDSNLASSLSATASEKDALAKKKSAAASALAARAELERERASQLATAGDTQGAIASNKMALALERKAIAANKASAALRMAAQSTSIFSKGLNLLGGPLGVAMIAFSVVSTLLSNYQQQMEEVRKKEAEAAQEASNTATTSIEAVSDWQEYNKVFQETGKASDEFKQKSMEVAEQLGIESAAALEATDS